MATISVAQFVREVRRRAPDLPPPHLDPLVVLAAKSQSATFEDRTVARTVVGIITGRDLDDSGVWALGATSLGWIAEFAERWSVGEYSNGELDELVRLLT